ncbi:3-hydroxyacyl-CoA dehydrogenase/enoyl-CoA hydratase family protein [Aquiflexum lacus]|uniref:3-hydroxyacyl-CoA dehydrogenase/enoyl-CoA hydratase family protein n=1 Tax=Aquiflexum lacus TaxID=2483805 RepID=UPI0018934E3E|nr:3-hydroxyacyl-CoA dehydrogenase/enoyl-CoA hydratase family protein [Aquiflexum lacus]
MKRPIKKIAVIGSGIMGSGIACHFANIGVEVLLLDIMPKEPTDEETKKGLTLEHKFVRNRIVNTQLQAAIKSKPAPLYKNGFANRISTGNLDDDLPKIGDVDWIIEVVVERLDIKQQIFEKVEKYRKPGTLITSNTSGIPIGMMSKGRSEDFQAHFCGTHFFNPVRYLNLFELIPGPKTKPEVIEFLTDYGDRFLGKTVVKAKDTPAFIGNRIGIFGIQLVFHLAKDLDLKVEEIDALTGPLIGRPKSATFRTADVVGLDTVVHVAKGILDNCPEDEAHELFKTPDFLQFLLDQKWLGSKSGQGFYKKEGKDILAFRIDDHSYQPQEKTRFESIGAALKLDDLGARFPVLVGGSDKASVFFRKSFAHLLAYSANRILEIADEVYQIDDAMKAGFGWEHGPFEIWDAIGFEKGLNLIMEENLKIPDWIEKAGENGMSSFYRIEEGARQYFCLTVQSYKNIPGKDQLIVLNYLRKNNTIWSNSESSVIDLGDGILNVEFHSKMNAIGSNVLEGINKGIELAEANYRGMIISNQAPNFSAGANLMEIATLLQKRDIPAINNAIAQFQQTTQRIRYSSIPVVAAPHGLTLGGGCEITLHADKVVAAAETYMGLIEFGVGLIPGGGGSKELSLRASDIWRTGDNRVNVLQQFFLTIATAKVSSSAYEAFDFGLMIPYRDIVVVNKDRLISVAKHHAVLMAEQGYSQPPIRKDVKVLGRQVLSMFHVGTDQMKAGFYASDHDKLIGNKLAFVMSGGDLTEPMDVSEEYLLNLERKAFLELLSEPKTQERIQSMLTTGKPLRN